MSKHRQPRPRKVPKPPSTDNPRTSSPRALREMRAAFRDLVTQNPRAASAALDVLEIVASASRRRSMQLVVPKEAHSSGSSFRFRLPP